ncbi:hypothetical protein AM593_04579, partial [Mytilus galloprovincialis]
LRLVYCLHALNHVLKDYRDQGLARPKVLIVIPFREAALRIVDIMISLLKSDEKSMVSNKKRFYSEYKLDNKDQRRGAKPEDYESTFTGNTDDHFRIGLGVAKKTLKLYTNFYASDIILASPLGLRTIIGSEGSKYYRQNIILSSVSDPQILSLFNKHCCNYNGKITLHRPETKGSISQVVVQLPQILPTHKDPVLAQTLIYVPSYFDFVRLRNYFVREDLSFVYISEFKVRGIKHIIFYELPLFPHFYSELCNMLIENRQENSSCTVMYSQYDVQKLTEIVGSDRASHMISSSKHIHMFVTGE